MTAPDRIPGATLDERLANLAGALAERGVTEITLIAGHTRRTIGARATDLPGELRAALRRDASVELEASDLRARVTRDSCEIR